MSLLGPGGSAAALPKGALCLLSDSVGGASISAEPLSFFYFHFQILSPTKNLDRRFSQLGLLVFQIHKVSWSVCLTSYFRFIRIISKLLRHCEKQIGKQFERLRTPPIHVLNVLQIQMLDVKRPHIHYRFFFFVG